jgi:phosphatidate cytidylyltransferase
MLARLRARGAVPGFRGVRPASKTVRRPQLTFGALTLRVISAIFAVPFLLGVAYVGDPTYGAFICLACGYAAYETRAILRAGGFAPQSLVLFATAVVLPLDAWLNPDAHSLGSDGILLLGLVVVVSLATLLFKPASDRSLVGWALSLGLALYVGGLMQFYFPLRRLPTDIPFPGFWVMALLGLSWVCDSSAFFIGRAFGRTPLALSISPKKSVEGAVAGLVGAALFGPVLGIVFGVSTLLMAGYGLAIAAATILGDLVESLIKRQTGAKDSGVLIPGHGGLLDRMDSLLFCAPVAVLYLRAFAG